MSETTVAIRVTYKDLTDAQNAAAELKKTLDSLKNTRFDLADSSSATSRKIHELEVSLQSLQRAAQSAKDALKSDPNDQYAKDYYDSIAKSIEEISAKLREAKREQKEASDAMRQNANDAKRAEHELTEAKQKEARVRQELDKHTSEMFKQEAEEQAAAQRTLNKEIESTVMLLDALGKAFKGLGTVSGWTSDFASGIGSAFSTISGMFSTDIAKYATASLTHQLMQQLVGETSKVVSRYDILNTFIPYMEIMGVDAATASAAQKAIDLSIRGLPIGLDEATQRFRRFNMYLNDPTAAQNLTIGLQNLVVAGGASSSAQNQAYTLIERMLATGTLRDVRQWQSLLVGLGVSQAFIEEELGYNRGGLLSAIRSGELDVENFLAAIERLGEGTSSVAEKVQSALSIYRSTIQSWLENIQYAVTRGNVAVLNAFNDTLQEVSGSGITDYLSKWRDTENNLFGWTADYIRNHPEQLESILNDIQRLLDMVTSLSATSFIESTVGNISTLVDIVETLFSAIPEGSLEDFAAFAITIAGPIGDIFAAVSSGAPYLIGVFDRFKEFDWNLFAKDLTSAVESLATMVSKILDLVDDPTMSKLLAYGLVYGDIGKTVFNGIGNLFSGFANGLASRATMAMMLYNLLRGGGTTFSLGGGISAIPSAYGAANSGMMPLSQLKSLDYALYGGPEVMSAGTLGLLGAFLAASGLMTYGAYRRDEKKIKEIQDRLYPQTIGGYASSIANIDNLLAERFDPATGYSTDPETQYLLYLREAYQRAYEEMLNNLPKGAKERESWRRVTQSLSGNANDFEWFETAGKYDYDVENPAVPVHSTVGAVLTLRDAYNELYDAAKESLEGQIELFADLDETIKESYDRLKEEQTQYQDWQLKVRELMSYATLENREVIQQLVEDGVDGMDRLDEAIKALTKDPHALDGLQRQLHNTESAMQSATGEAEDLIVMLQLLGDEAFTSGQMMGINLEYGIRSGASRAVLAAYEMAAAIRAAMGSISAAGWSQINATQYYDFESQPTGYWNGKKWVYRASGGPIYAADGRFVPRGTDTVPAMLTPGEFVMRRSAVDTFGTRFMKYINDLNIGAAFDSLVMSRDRLLHTGGVTYNNSRDNHATVNQNIVTNSPGFTYKRAGRFVRGLA